MIAYFLSDTHLGASYIKNPHEAERRLCSFLDSIKEEAEAIFLVGDILDYWYEYRYVVPRGYVRFFGKLAELADRGIRIVWYIGNHDIWIFDYLPNELGIEVVDGYTIEEMDGRRFLVTHGDGIGRLKRSFKMLRRLFRSKTCQKMFSAIHPRWTVPFAYRWSSHSRETGSLPGAQPTLPDADRMLTNINQFSAEMLEKDPTIDYFIYGHLHLLRRYPVPLAEEITCPAAKERDRASEIVVLGEWLHQCSYARWDGRSLTLHRYQEEA